jgi:hypothetical protein
MDLKPVKVQAEIMWAFLDTPNQLSGKYQVDLCNLSKEAIQTIESMGCNVRKKADQPEKGFFITAKSANKPIKAFDVNKQPIEGKIANGSKCVALLKPYTYEAGRGYKAGVSMGVEELMVTDLKLYTPAVSLTADDDDVL